MAFKRTQASLFRTYFQGIFEPYIGFIYRTYLIYVFNLYLFVISVQATSITMKPPRLHHASSVDSLLDESSMRESIMVNKRLHVASFIQNLSLEAHLYLRQVLNSIADCRRGPTQVQRSSTTMLDEAVGEAKTNTSSQSLKPTEPSRKMPPAPPAIEIDDPLEEKEHPLKYSKQQFVNSQDFVETSFFVLNDVFVNLLQDLVNSNET